MKARDRRPVDDTALIGESPSDRPTVGGGGTRGPEPPVEPVANELLASHLFEPPTIGKPEGGTTDSVRSGRSGRPSRTPSVGTEMRTDSGSVSPQAEPTEGTAQLGGYNTGRSRPRTSSQGTDEPTIPHVEPMASARSGNPESPRTQVSSPAIRPVGSPTSADQGLSRLPPNRPARLGALPTTRPLPTGARSDRSASRTRPASMARADRYTEIIVDSGTPLASVAVTVGSGTDLLPELDSPELLGLAVADPGDNHLATSELPRSPLAKFTARAESKGRATIGVEAAAESKSKVGVESEVGGSPVGLESEVGVKSAVGLESVTESSSDSPQAAPVPKAEPPAPPARKSRLAGFLSRLRTKPTASESGEDHPLLTPGTPTGDAAPGVGTGVSGLVTLGIGEGDGVASDGISGSVLPLGTIPSGHQGLSGNQESFPVAAPESGDDRHHAPAASVGVQTQPGLGPDGQSGGILGGFARGFGRFRRGNPAKIVLGDGRGVDPGRVSSGGDLEGVGDSDVVPVHPLSPVDPESPLADTDATYIDPESVPTPTESNSVPTPTESNSVPTPTESNSVLALFSSTQDEPVKPASKPNLVSHGDSPPDSRQAEPTVPASKSHRFKLPKLQRTTKSTQESQPSQASPTKPAKPAKPAKLPKPKRTRLSLIDTLSTASLGPRGRPGRAILSAVGIAIGIASLVAMLGIPASVQAEMQQEFEARGANLVFAQPAIDRRTNEATPLPETAPAMVGRIWPVKATLTIRNLSEVYVYRTDKIPAQETRGISAVIAQGDPLGTLSGAMKNGRWFDDASSTLPTVVLGENAAVLLGADVGQRLWIGQSWWAVIGVLDHLPNFVSNLNSSVFLAPGWAEQRWADTPISQIIANAYPGKADAVRSVLAATVNPAKPSGVEVMLPNSYGMMQDYLFDIFARLALALGSIALLVGGIGIANTMVVSVMERRGEIGVRRALGARTGQIALQFVLEAAFIGLFGGVLGVGIGAYAVFCFMAANSIAFAIPVWVLLGGPAISVMVGVLAGLYPSIKAARQSPTVTLRAI